MKNHIEVLPLARQTQNLLQHIDYKQYKNFDWATLLNDSLNILSHERDNDQSVGQVIGVIADLNEETAITVSTLYKYFSPGKADKMPSLSMLPLLMIACKSDAPLRYLAAAFGLRLVKDDAVLPIPFEKDKEAVQ